VNIATPGGDVGRKGHVTGLSRFVGKRRAIIKKGMRTSMDRKFVEEPIAIGTLTNQALNNGVRGGKTGHATLNADNKEVSKGCLSLCLNVRREKFEPDAERTMRTKRVQGRNKTTKGLSMLQHAIPPKREVGDGSRIENRELGLELLVIASVKSTSGEIRKKKFAIHVYSRSTNGMIDNNTIVGTRCNPRKDGTGGNIDNQRIGSMNVTLKVLPSGALLELRKGGAISKERRETQRIGKAGTMIGVPCRIGSRSAGRRNRTGSRSRVGNRSRSRRRNRSSGSRSRVDDRSRSRSSRRGTHTRRK
jgi:hypothetical protein